MKILVVHPYVSYPLDRGAHYRAFHLLRELAARHEVDLAALSENGEGLEHRSVFEALVRRVELVLFQHPDWEKLTPQRLLNPLPPFVAHWTIPHAGQLLRQMLAEGQYDCVQVCDLVLAQYFLRENCHWP